uniref:pro-neuregulin-2, membrane-bound isoform n=1 Tax=Ciona intestinalis TaxID=7719 RepID=UPI000180B29D|nr:pro-neuregulin-2, membrane-bound isoform [Ciona intestinalis]|eukprot:XP_002126754.1 pro-neuregulin-2, membrane-bound isoform [Ciona intestinalis]
MIFVQFYIFCVFISIVHGQSCRPTNEDFTNLAIKSPITVVVSKIKLVDGKGRKSERIFNATAKVSTIFKIKNDGIKKKQKIKFGPVGKAEGCVDLKKGKSSYLVFLKPTNESGFYWIDKNPVKIKKRSARKLSKLLCKGCLSKPSFKKSKKTYQKHEGDKLKIKCKASGKPKPNMSWFKSGILLNKSNLPNGMKIKSSKKGGASQIIVKQLTQEMSGVYVCSAKNPVSVDATNYTVTLIVTSVTTTTVATTVDACEPCPSTDAGFCFNGGQCCVDNGQPYCRCDIYFTGKRCKERSLHAVGKGLTNKDYLYHKRLVAILGMCVAVLLAAFICFAVYCLFRKKRTDLLDEKLKSFITKSEPQSFEDRRLFEAAINVKAPINDDLRYDGAADVTNEAHLTSRPSVTSITSNKRRRLNGLAKGASNIGHVAINNESDDTSTSSTLPRTPNLAGVEQIIHQQFTTSPLLHHSEQETEKSVENIPLETDVGHISNPVYQTITPSSLLAYQSDDYDVPRSHNDGLFDNIEIPDTSLSDGFYFPEKKENSTHPFVSSAQRQNLPLLSRQQRLSSSSSDVSEIGSHSIAV